jgi:hypothetical protein
MEWAALARFGVGPGRHGAVSVHDGAPFGIAPKALRRKAAREGWDRPYPGVVCLPGSADTFWRRHVAALLAVNGADLRQPLIAISGFSAAHAHGLVDRAKPVVQLTRSHELRSVELRGVTTFRSRHLGPQDVELIEGVPCTTVARTIRDLAWTLGVSSLRDLAIKSIQRGWLAVDDLAAQLDLMGKSVARQRLATVVVQLGDRGVDSSFEWEVRAALDERDLRPWPRPFRWRCRDGVDVELDIAWPWAWFAIECDGKEKFRLGRDFTTDRIRWSEIGRDWQMLWLDWARWTREREAILDDVERRLAEADRSRAPAQSAPEP